MFLNWRALSLSLSHTHVHTHRVSLTLIVLMVLPLEMLLGSARAHNSAACVVQGSVN